MGYPKGTREYEQDILQYSYDMEDYAEINSLLSGILEGKLKAPSDLVVRLYEDRKDLHRKIRLHERLYKA